MQIETKSQQEFDDIRGNDSTVTKVGLNAINVQRKQPRVLRINADNYDTMRVVIFWVLFVGIVIFASLLTLALPPTFFTITNGESLFGTELENCSNPYANDTDEYLTCNPVSSAGNSVAGLVLRGMSNRNQFMLIYMNFVLENIATPYMDIEESVSVTFYKLDLPTENGVVRFKTTDKLYEESIDYHLKSFESKRIYQENGIALKGYSDLLGFQKEISDESFIILFRFNHWPITNVQDIYITSVTVTPAFTVFSIVFRYLLFAVSLALCILYYLRFRIIPENLKTLEMRFVFYLGILTVFFNDPLYAATILAPNGFTQLQHQSNTTFRAFTSVAFIANYITFLIAFWIVFIDRILYESGEKFENILTKKKYAYFFILYLTMFTLQFQLAIYRFNDDPIIPSLTVSSGKVIFFEVMAFLAVISGICYIVVQYIRACYQLFDKIWRNQIFMIFSIIFVIMILIMAFVNGYGVYDYVGSRILIFFTFMNLYTAYMLYMYSVTDEQLSSIQKENILGHNDTGEVVTVLSNFGNEDVVLDLDSEEHSQSGVNKNHYANNKVPVINSESVQMRREQEEQSQEQLSSDGYSKNLKNKESNVNIQMEDQEIEQPEDSIDYHDGTVDQLNVDQGQNKKRNQQFETFQIDDD